MLVLEIQVTRQPWERRDRHHQAPTLEGINEPVKLIDSDTGNTIAVQALLGDTLLEEQRWLSRWLRFGMKWDDHSKGMNVKTERTEGTTGQGRLSGIRYPSRVFGFTEPKPLRRRWAASASLLTRDYPEVAEVIERFTTANWNLFQQHAPQDAEQHHALVTEKIHPDWLIGGHPWTSGVINNTAALPYHKDTGNIPSTWSAMLALRKNVTGGALHLPEYDVTFGIPDGSVTMFDGQGTWHGVTPMVPQRPDAYRFTLVWYTKSGIAKCGSAEEEAQEAKRRATR